MAGWLGELNKIMYVKGLSEACNSNFKNNGLFVYGCWVSVAEQAFL